MARLLRAYTCETKEGDGLLLSAATPRELWELLYVEHGALTLHTAFYRAPLQAGEFCIVPEGVSRYVTGEGCLRVVRFSPCFFMQLSERYEQDLQYMFELRARSTPSVIDGEHPLYARLSDCFHLCYEELCSREIFYDLRISAHLSLIFADLLSTYSGAYGEGEQPIYRNILRLSPALQYMEAHLAAHISLAELAGEVPLAPDYFTKLFRESMGETPVDYMQSLRVNCAMELLATTDDAVPAIAKSLGVSASYLAELFREALGVTPTAYRKMSK